MTWIKSASLLFSLIILLACPAQAQHKSDNPTASWKYEWKKISADELDLVMTCTLSPGYHIYSITEVKDQIPIPTTIAFEKSGDYQLEGNITESNNRIERYDSTADMKLLFFENTAVFTQRVKLLSDSAVVKADINFMTCNNKLCIPPSDVIIEAAIKK